MDTHSNLFRNLFHETTEEWEGLNWRSRETLSRTDFEPPSRNFLKIPIAVVESASNQYRHHTNWRPTEGRLEADWSDGARQEHDTGDNRHNHYDSAITARECDSRID
eukprot:gene6955-biopygen2484